VSYYKFDRELEIDKIKPESVEDFLARGGKVQTNTKAKSNKIDAQALLDAAMGTENEAAVIKFLISQGLDVE
jgi:hypothetical protein